MDREFEWAIKNGDLDKVTEMARKPGFDVNSAFSLKRKPLHVAADYGQCEILEFLISQGANVNVEDQHGITPLLNAIYEGHKNCVELLIAKGADKSGKTPSGGTYLDAAEDESIRDLLK